MQIQVRKTSLLCLRETLVYFVSLSLKHIETVERYWKHLKTCWNQVTTVTTLNAFGLWNLGLSCLLSWATQNKEENIGMVWIWYWILNMYILINECLSSIFRFFHAISQLERVPSVCGILWESTLPSMSNSIKRHFNRIAHVQTRFSLSQSLNCTGNATSLRWSWHKCQLRVLNCVVDSIWCIDYDIKINETVSNLVQVFWHGC